MPDVRHRRSPWRVVLGLAGVVGAVSVTALAAGQWRWSGLTRELLQRLEAAKVPPAVTRYDERELQGLPAPVQRYFRAALRPGVPIVTAVDIEHAGEFNLGEDGDRWMTFRSTQRVITRRPGFVWDGRVRMAPGLAVHVHDAYVAGEGILHPAVAGLVSLADLRGTDAVAVGELMRWLAEAAWYPTALLPSQGVRWEPVDDRSARASMQDGGHRLTLTFFFGDDDLVQGIRAEARGRTVGGRIVDTPWEGRWSGFEWRDGLRVPSEGEVAWVTPQGRHPYWRGRVTKLRYEFAP